MITEKDPTNTISFIKMGICGTKGNLGKMQLELTELSEDQVASDGVYDPITKVVSNIFIC